MSERPKTPEKAAEEIVRRLGLAPEVISSLHAEVGWSFVLKAEALIESAVTGALTHAIPDQRLHPFLGRLGMDKKLHLVKALDLMDERSLRVSRYMLELRNRLSHDIRELNFTFIDHLSAPESLKRFRDAVAYPDTLERVTARNGQLAAWLGVISVLADIYLAGERVELIRAQALLELRKLWLESDPGAG